MGKGLKRAILREETRFEWITSDSSHDFQGRQTCLNYTLSVWKNAAIANQPFKRLEHHESTLMPYHDIMATVQKRILCNCKRNRNIMNLSERPDAGKYHG